ncbi:MAG: DUF1634 domain-containing protein [Anaerolineae bacterium]
MRTERNSEGLWLPTAPEPTSPPDPNAWMRPTAIATSTVALALMLAGFLWLLVTSAPTPLTLPGESGVPPSAWIGAHSAHPGVVLMSAGMILLGLLPVVRVGLALMFYLTRRAGRDALAAIAVLVILLISMFLK